MFPKYWVDSDAWKYWRSVCFAAEWATECMKTLGIIKIVMYRNCPTELKVAKRARLYTL